VTPALALSPASHVRRFVSFAIDAVRTFRWPQARAAFALGLAAEALSVVIFIFPTIQIAATMPIERVVLGMAISFQINAFCLVLAVVIADRAVDAGTARRFAYVSAVIGGCAAGIALSEPFGWLWRTYALPDGWPAYRTWLHGTAGLFYWPIFDFAHWLLIGGAAVFFYADRRAARQTAARLEAATLDRIRRSKLALEARLQALQARVEPQFLFNTLDEVERLYELDPARGAEMLDELIAYLRAAMPQMRDTSSTMGRELALVGAYLAILRIRHGQRLAYAIDASRETIDAGLPPMTLLPLVDHALARESWPIDGQRTLLIRSIARGRRLCVSVHAQGGGFIADTGDPAIAGIRERLHALYGEDASLVLERAGGDGMRAHIELPLERSIRCP